MTIVYARELEVDLVDFVNILERSGLAARRPMDDRNVLEGMIRGADLWIVARDSENEGRIIGIARCLTDFSYICYCSELAVDRDYQTRGIGRRILESTRNELGSDCPLLLLAAPDAEGFYESVGMERVTRAYSLAARQVEPAS